jgi:hypothetical protein
MDSNELRKRQRAERKLQEAKDALTRVVARVTDGNLEGALHEMGDALALTDALGPLFTISHWPVCIGCQKPGSGEVAHPTEQDGRPILCTEAGDRCMGNRYGRMHPAQLHDFIVAKLRDRAERQEADRLRSLVEGREIVEETDAASKLQPDTMRPTPPPGFAEDAASAEADADAVARQTLGD